MTNAFASYSVQVKWDGSNWEEEWSNVKQITINQGRTGGVLSQPEIGALELVMRNGDMRYSPAYAAGDLYGELVPGKEVRVRALAGAAASFDGSSYLQMDTDHADFKIASHLSLGCIFKRTADGASQRLIAKADPAGALCYQLMVDESNGIVAEVAVEGLAYSVADATATGAGWYLAIVTHDHETLRLYTASLPDGALSVASTSAEGDITDSTELLTIGADSSGGNEFTGLIYNAFVRADWLSAFDVQRILNRGAAHHPVSDLLAGWWTFKNLSAADDSGNSHSLSATGTVTYPALTDLYNFNLYYGKTTSFRMEIPQRQANIGCETEEGPFKRQDDNTVPLVTATTGELVGDALDSYGWDADNRLIDVGLTNVPIGGWSLRSGLDVSQELADAEFGLFYFDQAGWPTFENRDHRRLGQAANVQANFDGTDLIADAEYLLDASQLYNYITRTTNPRVAQPTSVLWSSGYVPFYRTSGSTKISYAYYLQSGQKVEAANVVCVANTDYVANAQADGLGADRTANLTVAIVSSGSQARITLTTTADLYVTKLQLRGTIYQNWQPESISSSDPTSITAYGRRSLVLDNSFWQEQAHPLEDVPFIHMLLARFANPLGTIDPLLIQANRNPEHLRTTLLLHLSERIMVSNAMTGISNAEFFVEHIQHSISHGATPHHVATILVEPVSTWGSWEIGVSTFDDETKLAY